MRSALAWWFRWLNSFGAAEVHQRIHEHRSWPVLTDHGDWPGVNVVADLCRPRGLHFGFWNVGVRIGVVEHPIGVVTGAGVDSLMGARNLMQVHAWMAAMGHTCDMNGDLHRD
jgi:hypothetical protein